MKVPLTELLAMMGIDQPMGPYDSQMWSADDEKSDTTCTAQCSMNEYGDALESSIMTSSFMSAGSAMNSTPILFFHAKQDLNGNWTPDTLKLKGEGASGKYYEWEKKAGEFFVAVTASLSAGAVPDIDELIERIFKSYDTYGSGTAGGGKRNPTIRPEQLLDPGKRGL
jgi:hypothetical protein